jgi:hypothetical protein
MSSPTTWNVVKQKPVLTNDITGLQTSRYEKLEVGFGVIPSTAYTVGDTFAFNLPSREVVRATFWSSATSPQTLVITPGTNLASPITFPIGVSGTSGVAIAYVIEYVRGTGRPDTDDTQGSQVQITTATGT